jgi:2-polyprenyl-3-methyl-5-hydroxy-6-metoxy-1,4-benzoquinol methylase
MDRYSDYLEGKRFDNYVELKIPFENQNTLESRKTLLTRLVKGKKIIHVGCVDHLEIIDAKIASGDWIHKDLHESAARCLGIDIIKEGVDYMKNKLGYSDVICHNLVTDAPAEIILNEQWDYIVLGEILEHVDNPVEFLTSIRNKYGKVISKIIVTVPNAFNLNNFRKAFKNIEHVNSDHRYWFTPYTLSKVLTRSGIKPQKIYTSLFMEPGSRGFFSKKLLKRCPLFRDTLIAEGSF